MLANERRTRIMQELARQSTVTIRDLTEKLGVTRETVRKDIERLSEEGRLNQVRGGAVRVMDWEPPLAERLRANNPGKSVIANFVVELIPDGASVIVDSGSTTLMVSERLARTHKDLTIYTNDLSIALTFGPTAKEVIMLGGRMDPRENAVFGIDAIEHLQKYRADFALIGVAGVSADNLVTDFSRETAALREKMMLNSAKSFILADSSKFGMVGRTTINVGKKTSILSDAAPDPELRLALQLAGIRFVAATDT
ncbi:MAG: DeoR/GlpR family DNA-binding transcription regulator [Paracoccaceae bacterium]